MDENESKTYFGSRGSRGSRGQRGQRGQGVRVLDLDFFLIDWLKLN